MKWSKRTGLWAVTLAAALAADGGSLAGRVTAVSGGSLTNVFIDLYDESGEYFDFTVTDNLGNYRFSNLGQGGFYVHTDTLGAYAEEWYNNVPGASDDTFFDPLEAGATLISVAYYASVTGVNVALERAGAIAGRVTDDGGRPVTNAYVDAYLPAGGRFLSDLTDTNGVFRLAGLPAGSYSVRTDTLGAFVDEWNNGSVAFDSVTPAEAGVPALPVTAGGLLTNVNFQLGAGAEIRGVLLNDTGSPVPGAYVDLFGAAGTRLEFDRSDTNGVYQLKGLPAGDYYLGTDTLGSFVELWYRQKPMLNPDQPALDGADLVAVPTGQVVAGRDFTFDAGAVISGYVVNTAGQPVADAIVDVYRGSNFFDFGETDTAGVFRVAALPDGVYYVKTDTLGRYLDEWHDDAVVMDVDDPVGDGADPVVVTNGASVTGLVFQLRLGGEISGRISDILNQGVTNEYVDLYTGAGRRLLYTRSGTNGQYRLGGLPAGSYFLSTDTEGRYADEWYDDRPVVAATNPADDGARSLDVLLGARLTNVNLQLRRGGSIAGSVGGTNGTPQAGAVVRLFYGSRPFAGGTTATNGAYGFTALPAGTYYLRTDGVDGLLDEWYLDTYIFNEEQPVVDGATPVVLADDEARAGISFALGYGAVITGTVRNADGQALGGVFVDLYDAQGRPYDSVVTLADGSFRFDMVPPGTWYVGTDTFGLYADEWFDSATRDFVTDPAEAGATAVTAQDGKTAAAVFVLAWPPPSPAVLTIAPPGPPAMVIEWQAKTNRAYQVQRTGNLPAGAWGDAPSGIEEIETSLKPAGPAGLRQYRDPSPPSNAVYRVRSL